MRWRWGWPLWLLRWWISQHWRRQLTISYTASRHAGKVLKPQLIQQWIFAKINQSRSYVITRAARKRPSRVNHVCGYNHKAKWRLESEGLPLQQLSSSSSLCSIQPRRLISAGRGDQKEKNSKLNFKLVTWPGLLAWSGRGFVILMSRGNDSSSAEEVEHEFYTTSQTFIYS